MENQTFMCKYCSLKFENFSAMGEHVCRYFRVGDRILFDEHQYEVDMLQDWIKNHPVFKMMADNRVRSAMLLRDYRDENVTANRRVLSKKDVEHFKCNICDRTFVHVSGLSRHLERHGKNDFPKTRATRPWVMAVVCKLCTRVFERAGDLAEHYQTHFYASPDDDENMVMDPEILVTKLEYLHSCEMCAYVFTNYLCLRDHFHASHCSQNMYTCTTCEVSMPSMRDFCIHRLIECTDREAFVGVRRCFWCFVCNSVFGSLDELHAHRRESLHFVMGINPDTNLPQLNCTICGFVTGQSDKFILHDLEHCNELKEKDTNRAQVPSTKSRQHLCDVCGKTYTQSSHLLQHLRFHQGVRPFECTVKGCTRKFTIRPDLNDHIRKCHTRERPYHCLVCDKRFLTGSVYYQHRLIHRGERRYACDECDKRFYRADALKNHRRIHTGEKPFKCEFCVKHFRQRGDRDKHIRARHHQQTIVRVKQIVDEPNEEVILEVNQEVENCKIEEMTENFNGIGLSMIKIPSDDDDDQGILELPNNMLQELIEDIDLPQ